MLLLCIASNSCLTDAAVGLAPWARAAGSARTANNRVAKNFMSRLLISSALVPHADHQRIDLRRPQLPAHPVELVETGDRPDAHAMPDAVVHRDALYLGVDPLERELRAHPVVIGLVAISALLQHVLSRQ